MCKFLKLITVAIFLITACGTMPGQAGERERNILRGMLGGEPVRAEMFAPTFLRKIPVSRLQAIIAHIRRDIGEPVGVAEYDGRYIIKTKTHEMPATISLDATDKITGLFFQAAVETGRAIEDILADMKMLGGDVAYLVTKNGRPLYQHNEDRKLAAGSAFKLAVLAQLVELIETGRAHWDDVVKLKKHHISLPTGILHKLPVGSPVTLHTLAVFMISRSDNTATDALFDVVGREAVAAKLDMEFVLKTREFFALKADAALRKQFFAGDMSQKKKLFAVMAKRPLPDVGKVGVPHIQGVEYYVSLKRLCMLISKVAAVDVMSIARGFAQLQDWQHIAFKGGSEPGVLNFTTHLTGHDGLPVCVAFTWNASHRLARTKANSLYTSLIKKLSVVRAGTLTAK